MRLLVKMVYGGLEVGSLDDAARSLLRAIELRPDRLVHRVVYARILLKQNKKDAAIEQLDAAVSMRLEDINAKLERAEAFRMRDKLGLPPVPPGVICATGEIPAPLVPAVPAAAAQRVSFSSSSRPGETGGGGSGGGRPSAVTFATPVMAAAAS